MLEEGGVEDTPPSTSPDVPKADSASPQKIQQEQEQELPKSPNTKSKEKEAAKEREESSRSPAQSTRSHSKSRPGPKPAPKPPPPRQRAQPPKKTLEAEKKKSAANRRQQQSAKKGRKITRQTTLDSQTQAGTSSQAGTSTQPGTSTQVLKNTDTHVVDEEGCLVNFRLPHPSIRGLHPSPKKGRSPFYDAFHASPTDLDTVWCNLCGAKLQCTTKMGTASVRSHLSHKHPNLFNHLKKPGQTEAKIFESATGKRGRVDDPQLHFKDGSTAASSTSKRAKVDSTKSQLYASLHRYNFESIIPQDRDNAQEKALVTQTCYLVCNGRPFSDANNPEFREILEAAYQVGVKKVPFYFPP